VVKSLALFCRHLTLLGLCHLFSRQATRKRDLVYTYSAVDFGLLTNYFEVKDFITTCG
jgi:hypothetical protein